MMTLDAVVDDATAKQWFREQWRRPEFVEEVLDGYQYTAIAGALRYPDLLKVCTVHMLASADGFYCDVLKCARMVQYGRDAAFDTTARLWARGWPHGVLWRVLGLYEHAPSRQATMTAIDRARKIVEWQFKKRKEAICTN